MYISDEFINSDFEDPKLHLKNILKATLTKMQNLYNKHPNNLNYYNSIDTLNVIIEFANTYEINNELLVNSAPTTSLEIINLLNKYYFAVIAKETSIHYKELFNKKIYLLPDDDYKSIQNHINSLREKINNSKDFTNEHKIRLLQKLEKLQSEIHKKMASFDNVLSNIVSIGHILGKTTKEAKPLIDEIKDILKIVFKNKEKTENLPNTSNQIETNDIFQIADNKTLEDE